MASSRRPPADSGTGPGAGVLGHPDIETASDGYARRFEGPVGEYFLATQFETIRRSLLGLERVRTVLDVGGGHAQVAPRLVAMGYEVTVLGSGPQAFRPLQDGEPSFTREVGDLIDLPFDDSSFDVALSVRTLPHMDDWPKFIGELCRVARVAVVLDYPTWRSINVVAPALFRLKLLIEKNTRPFTLFSRSEIARVFAQLGYHVTSSRPQFFFPMGLYRMFGSASLARALETPPRSLALTRLLGSPIITTAVPIRRLKVRLGE